MTPSELSWLLRTKNPLQDEDSWVQSTQSPREPRLVLLTRNPSFPHLPGNCVSLHLPLRVSFSVCRSLSTVLSVSTPLCVSVSSPCFTVFLCSLYASPILCLPLCASHSVFVSLILGVSQPLSDQLSLSLIFE